MSFPNFIIYKKIELLLNQFNFHQRFPSKQPFNDSTMSSSQELFPNPANIFRQESEPKQSEPKQSEPSICIPRVFKSTTRKDLYTVIERLDLGAVERIDMVPKTNERNESYYKVFIHFKQWNNKTTMAQATRTKLLQGEEVKIVYNEPWFWKCTASRVEKPAFRDYSAPPPRIDLGGCKSLSKDHQ